MNNHKLVMIKIFIVSISLLTYGDFSIMLKDDSSSIGITAGSAPWLQLCIFLAYIAMPIIVLLINNYVSYTLLAGVFLLRPIIELVGAFPWTLSFHMVLAPFYILAAFFSLILAVENISSKISGEIFKLKWSQF